ncbi:unnamed protein product [Schistosoma margrebowiei]|uniref:Uncharacterized protein n=1 Tax=Schistosoma margrebowiei TaxID=48269 RepID=A0A183LP66_9TREM|nr:unnamed protein product [Schistosoma margrebowiei]
MEDVKTKKEANIAPDRHLVVAKLKLKLIITTGQTTLQIFNTVSLRNAEKLNKFKMAFINRFQDVRVLLKEAETTV